MNVDRLEKLDMIRDRTGASYGEADAALTRADGDVVKAIIELEQKDAKHATSGETGGHDRITEEIWVKGNELVDKVKELIKKGNVTRVVVKNEEGEILVEIPMTIGVVGTVLAPTVAILGGLAAIVTKCKIEIERKKDSSDVSQEAFDIEESNDDLKN